MAREPDPIIKVQATTRLSRIQTAGGIKTGILFSAWVTENNISSSDLLNVAIHAGVDIQYLERLKGGLPIRKQVGIKVAKSLKALYGLSSSTSLRLAGVSTQISKSKGRRR